MNTLMKPIGVAALILGFLGASLSTMLDPEKVQTLAYGAFLLLGVAGVGLIRLEGQRLSSDQTALAGQLSDLDASLAEIKSTLDDLITRSVDVEPPPAGKVGVYDLPEAIDDTLRDPITRFVDARESIAHVHGTQAYADIMGEFAAGERYLNRVWSAAAEGYVDEAGTYLERACQQFERAHAGLSNLGQASSRD